MLLSLKTLCVLVFILVSVSDFCVCGNNKTEYKSCSNTTGPGEPLLLTPLIEKGRITEARKKASVKSFLNNIKSYAGYFTVNKNFNSNLFFWFFKAQDKNWKNLPVAVWLEGGPGCPSVVSLFILNGPYTFDNETLQARLHSWHKKCNMIYIDNPVGTGFSFTDADDGYARNQTIIGEHLYSAIKQFFIMFPNLINNDFFVTGESYAGKYVPSLAYTIYKNNALATSHKTPLNKNDRIFINLKGLLIGNGLVDPINQLNYGDFLYQLGLIDRNTLNTFHKYENETVQELKMKNWDKAPHLISKLVLTSIYYPSGSVFQNATGIEPYNYINQKMPEWTLSHENFVDSNTFRCSVHVGGKSFNEKTKVAQFLKQDLHQSVVDKVEELLNHYRIGFYNGQFDILVAYPLTVNFIKKMTWNSANEYAKAERHIWRVNSDIAGYYKTAGNLTEILVRNAGHFVPSDQPLWAHVLFNKFITNKNLNEQ